MFQLSLDSGSSLVIATLPTGESEIRFDRCVIRSQIVSPQMVTLFAAQRVQRTITGVPESFLIPGLHQYIVHIVAALLRDVQFVSQLSDEAHSQDSHVALIERVDLDAQNGSGIRWKELFIVEIEIGDLLKDLSALWSLDGQYAQLFGMIGNYRT